MKKYQAILFDADETLLDFSKSERMAFEQTLEFFGMECTEELLSVYSKCNKECWLLFEQEKITKQELMILRFQKFAKKSGMEIDAALLNERYKALLAQSGYLLPGAKDILEFAKGHFDIYIVTNGIADIQRNRIRNAGIEHYFNRIFISEEIGVPKPKRGYFESVFNQIPYNPAEALLVGDSLTSDIRGGLDYGIDTCFLNWKQEENNATYSVKDLDELLKLLVMFAPDVR